MRLPPRTRLVSRTRSHVPWPRLLLALLVPALLAAQAAAALRPRDLDLEPRLFSINLLRFSPTRNVSLLQQYFRKNILKHRDQTGAYLETVEHNRTRVLEDFPVETRKQLMREWLAELGEDHPDLRPRLDAARLYVEWTFAASLRPPPASEELGALARATEEALAGSKVSPWTYLVAGLVADLLAGTLEDETGDPALAPTMDLWAKGTAAAQNEDSHFHFVLGDLFSRTLDRDNIAVFCKKVATEYEKALLVSPGDKQLYTAVAGRYHEIYEGLQEGEVQLPFWFEELVFKRLIAVEPTNARAHNNLSFLYSQYGVNLKEALKEAQIANQLMPGDPNLMDTLGWAYYKLGEHQKAVEILEKALELDDTLPDVHFHLATVLYDSGRYEEAAEEFRATVALDPDNAFALNNLAYLFAERNVEVEEGLALVERALRLEPGNSAFLDTKGWLLFRLGRLEEAAEFVGRAIELQPEVSELHLHMGEIRLAAGDFPRATDHFEKALTYDPQNQELARTLARVYALHGVRQGLARFARIGSVDASRENFEVFYRAMAEIYQTDGLYEESIASLQEYQRLEPGKAPEVKVDVEPASAGTRRAGPGGESDLPSAVRVMPRETDLVVTLERAGLIKLVDLIIESSRLPFPLAPFRPTIVAGLPTRALFAFDAGSRADEGPGLTALLQLQEGQSESYAQRLEKAGELDFTLPGGSMKVRVRTGRYKNTLIGEVGLSALGIHFAMLDGAVVLAQKKSTLLALLDAPAGAAPPLAGLDAFRDLAARLDGSEDALLIGHVPALVEGPAREKMEPGELDFLQKLELIGSRYMLDAEEDALREHSVLYPRGDALLTGDAAFADTFARSSLARLPAAGELVVESSFGVVENRIQGTLLIRGVQGWVKELLERLSQAGVDLPDLDLEGEPGLPELEDDEEPLPDDFEDADDGSDEPGIPVPELDGDGD